MKEAIIINIDGYMTGVTLVADEVTGVFPIYGKPEPDEEGEAVEPVLVGYSVAIRPPTGLYKPRFDLESETWGEGLTPEEIDEIRNAPLLPTAEERIANLETHNATLIAHNAILATESEFAKLRYAQLQDDQMFILETLLDAGIIE